MNALRQLNNNGSSGGTNGQNDGIAGFMPYHQTQFMGTMPSQRSPIDVLLR